MNFDKAKTLIKDSMEKGNKGNPIYYVHALGMIEVLIEMFDNTGILTKEKINWLYGVQFTCLMKAMLVMSSRGENEDI